VHWHLLLHRTTPTLASSPSAQPHPAESRQSPWRTLQRGSLPETDASVCNNNPTSHRPAARLHPFPRWQSGLSLVTLPSQPRGSLSWTDANTCNDNTQPPPAPLPAQTQLTAPSGFGGFTRLRTRGGTTVTCDSPSNPTHHARPLMSALPPRDVRTKQPSIASVGRTSEPVHVPHVCCVSLLHRHRRVWNTLYRSMREREWSVTDCARRWW
jgi:hypothetical protein